MKSQDNDRQTISTEFPTMKSQDNLIRFPWYCIMEYYFDIACIPLFEILFQNILSIWFFISILYYPNCINIACKRQ
jgi:hypothetical protein